MKLIKFFKVLFNLVLFVITIYLAFGWLNYFVVSKPKAKMLVEDIGTYVEANDVQLTEEWLEKFVLNEMEHDYIKEGDTVSVNYSQGMSDRRFKVQVRYTSSYSSHDAMYSFQGTSYAEAPVKSILLHVDTYSLRKWKTAADQETTVLVNHEDKEEANAVSTNTVIQ